MATGNSYNTDWNNGTAGFAPVGATGGASASGLYMPSGSTLTLTTPTPKVGTPKILEALVTRRVVLTMQDSPYENIVAEDEADTGVVSVTIGCQVHPLARWRRVGERLIRGQYGEAEAKRLAPSLKLVLDRIEKEFARKR